MDEIFKLNSSQSESTHSNDDSHQNELTDINVDSNDHTTFENNDSDKVDECSNNAIDFHLLPQISSKNEELIFADGELTQPNESLESKVSNDNGESSTKDCYSESGCLESNECGGSNGMERNTTQSHMIISTSTGDNVNGDPVSALAEPDVCENDSSDNSFHLVFADIFSAQSDSTLEREYLGISVGLQGQRDTDRSQSNRSDASALFQDNNSSEDSELLSYINTAEQNAAGNVAVNNRSEGQNETVRRQTVRKRQHSYVFSSSSEDDSDNDDILSSDSSTSSKSSKVSKHDTPESNIVAKPLSKDLWFHVKELRQREIGFRDKKSGNVGFWNRIGGSINFVQKLSLYTRYEFHKGCVNALNFNESGTLIASGSDDLKILIWDWAKNRQFLSFDSNHRSNVFQTKFMPYTGDCHIVSCARDGQVRLAQLSVTGTCKNSKKLVQHKGAAHKLALLQDSSHIFYSCGEDGVIYQIDLRQEKPTKCYVTKENNRRIPLYSIHTNPYNTSEHCVAGRDQYIRIYDARKIDESNTEQSVVKKFCPHNLLNGDVKAHITCAVYNYNGKEIVSSYNDEDIYLFDNTHSDGADFVHRYEGHRNNATVKGVNFYGPKSEFIVSGSDCGNVFFWETKTEAIVNYFHADDNNVINVLEPHPHLPMLATSGLDNDVKVWMPLANEPSDLKDLHKVTKKNKRERENERNAPDIIDSQLLWFLMHSLRRRRLPDEDEASSSDDTDSGNSDTDQPDEDGDGELDEDGGGGATQNECSTS